jgi:hypothetical protein
MAPGSPRLQRHTSEQVAAPAVRHGREPVVVGDRLEPRPLVQLDRHRVPDVGEVPRFGGPLRHALGR